jgi:hypothetical protein
MYKLISNLHGQISTQSTLEKAIYWAGSYASKGIGHIITVYFNDEVVYQTK